MITKAPPQLPDKEYVEKTRQIYLMAIERRLKRETILTGRQRDILICIVGVSPLLKKTGEKDKVGLVLWLLGFGSYANSQFTARVHAEMNRAGKPCDCPKCSSEAARPAKLQPIAKHHQSNHSTRTGQR
jgi:hypothetical protein